MDVKKIDAKQEVKPIGSAIMKKGDAQFRHDLFELKTAIGKKNEAPYSKSLKLTDIEHKHYFHSFDTRRGKRLDSTLLKQGHIHKMELIEHKDGSVDAKCGPALMEKIIVDDNGDVLSSEWVPVSFKDKRQKRVVIDDHTHDVVYLGSEIVSTNLSKAKNNQTAKEIAAILKEGL